MYRGHVGRKEAAIYKKERTKEIALKKKLHSSATIISRAWRGYEGRKVAKVEKVRFETFVKSMQEVEEIEDEDISISSGE